MQTAVREIKIIEPTVGIITQEHKQRVAAYCRVSTDSDDQANSFLAQVRYYKEFISSSDTMVLVDIYADEGITGTCINKRDEFKRLIKDCSNGRIDRILTKSVSRFARNSLECLETIRQLKDYGVSVFFENDNIDTRTMNSEMILYVKSAFAQSEALAGSKRVSTAYRMKMENGAFTTYHTPFGYRLVDQKLIVEPGEAEVVRRIFKLYLAGNGINRIAALLNSEMSEGNTLRWNNSGVRYILTNEKYIGDSLLQKTYTPEMLPLRNRPNNGALDKYYVTGTHEAIISKEDFNTAQQILAGRINTTEQTREKYLFSRKIICVECGWAYRRKIQNGKVYWVCSRKGMSGFVCGGQNYSEESICTAFVRMYNKLRRFEKEILDTTITQLTDLRNKLTAGNSEIKSIDIEISKLCEQNNQYEKYHMKKIMDDISYMEQTGRLKKRITELRNRRLKLLNENEDERIIESLRVFKDTVQEYPMAVMAFDAELFEVIVDKIKAGNNRTLTFVLKGGLCLKERVG